MSYVGKLDFLTDKWYQLTNDPWVLEAISGYKILFDTLPYQVIVPNEIPFQGEQWHIVHNEVSELLSKGAVVPCRSYQVIVPNEIPFQGEQWHIVHNEVSELLSKGAVVPCRSEPEFISTLFIDPKQNGKFRPVINLRYLNLFVHYDHFKQETFKVILDLVQKNDYFTSIDLSDAYFSVPIRSDYQKYLKFSWNGHLFKFVCLPFGLKSAPFVFIKILKPVYAWFRQQNIRCSYYIDDSINMNYRRMSVKLIPLLWSKHCRIWFIALIIKNPFLSLPRE